MSAGILSAFLFCLLSLSSVWSTPNCPGERKRSPAGPGSLVITCTPCGPNNSGKCFGPNLCCPENQMCFRGPEVDRQCQRERCLPSPCRDRRRVCRGQCRAGGLCCNDFGCYRDSCCPQG